MLPDNLCIIHSSLWLREWQNPGQATLIGFLGLDLDTEANGNLPPPGQIRPSEVNSHSLEGKKSLQEVKSPLSYWQSL